MKNFFLKQAAFLVAAALTSVSVHAQDYTWIKGANIINQTGISGTIGVAAPANNPAARTQMAGWKDAAGNFWLFGGMGIDANGPDKNLSDLWKYNPATNQWALMHGSSTGDQSGSYGTFQVPDPTNMPGGRYTPVSWTDQAGNFWLFGGSGYDEFGQAGDLNDLWKYNIATNEWAWMNGSSMVNQVGTYGSIGVPSSGNTPGSREGAAAWTDASGNLWLFGGYGLGSAGGQVNLNDLWKYNTTTNKWTWVSGSNTGNQSSNYGTQGTPAATNLPGGRSYAGTWTDASGNFWLQAGFGYGTTPMPSILRDLWKYNTTTNQWTWMSGGSTFTTSPLGVYGTQGVQAATNMPGGRGTGTYWTDALGNLWQFGGSGYATAASNPTSGNLNDLWKYNITANQWTWMKGNATANPAGVYGTQGTAALLNTPGGRYGAVSWKDNSGGLWFFGGHGNTTTAQSGDGYLSDLWKFQSCVNQTVTVQGAASICSGSSATLTASGASAFSWSTQQSGPTITVSPASTTTYTIQSADPNTCGSAAYIAITVNALPPVIASSSKSIACSGESVTLNAAGATTYSWNSGQTSANIQVVAGNTTYTVTGTDANGCSKAAAVAQATTACTGIQQHEGLSRASIYPNPTNGKITISAGSENLKTELYNSLGIKVEIADSSSATEIDFSGLNLKEGIYFISISEGGVLSTHRIIYTK